MNTCDNIALLNWREGSWEVNISSDTGVWNNVSESKESILDRKCDFFMIKCLGVPVKTSADCV